MFLLVLHLIIDFYWSRTAFIENWLKNFIFNTFLDPQWIKNREVLKKYNCGHSGLLGRAKSELIFRGKRKSQVHTLFFVTFHQCICSSTISWIGSLYVGGDARTLPYGKFQATSPNFLAIDVCTYFHDFWMDYPKSLQSVFALNSSWNLMENISKISANPFR